MRLTTIALATAGLLVVGASLAPFAEARDGSGSVEVGVENPEGEIAYRVCYAYSISDLPGEESPEGEGCDLQ